MPVGMRQPTSGASTGNVVLAPPPGTSDGDFLILAVESNGGQPVAAPAGWTELGSSPQDTGAGQTRLSVFRKVAGAAEGSTTIIDPGDHLAAVMFAFFGVDISGTVGWTQGDTGGSSTAVTFPKISAGNMDAGDFCLHLCAFQTDTTSNQLASFTSAELELLGNPYDTGSYATNQGNGGGIIWGAGFSIAGNETDATAVLVSASPQARLTVTMKPDATASAQTLASRLTLATIPGVDEAQVARVAIGTAARPLSADEVQVPRLTLGFVVEIASGRRRNYSQFVP